MHVRVGLLTTLIKKLDIEHEQTTESRSTLVRLFYILSRVTKLPTEGVSMKATDVISMKLSNPLEANDWDIATFFKLIASLQVSVWIVIALDAVGVHVPILREGLVLVYLLFVPGIIILRVLRLHELNVTEGFFYTVLLSVATIMLTGLFMNTVYVRGITSTPLTLVPFIATMSGVILALCVLSYHRDRDYSRSATIDARVALSPVTLSLLLLPFMGVFGAYLFNASGTSVGTVLVLLAVAALILVCGFTRYVPKRYYSLAIVAIALALLLHNALVTNYLWGFDIQFEHLVAQTVVNNGFWGAPPNFSANAMNLNAMLSITMLAPLLSIATGMSVTWVLKLVYPLLFALVPLGLYRLYEKQTSPRVALFGVFFFMVTFSFYTEMLTMAREEIAELFLVALLLLLVEKQMRRTPRLFLFGLFGFSLIVSHYAMTYIFLFCFILAWLMLLVVGSFDVRALTQRVARTLGADGSVPPFRRSRRLRSNTGLSAGFVVGFTLLAAVWYRFANNSEPFDAFAHIFTRTLVYLGLPPLAQISGAPNASDIPAPTVISLANGPSTTITGIQSILTYQLPLHQVTEYLLFIALITAIVGIFFALKDRSRLKFSNEYLAFSAAMLVVLYLCLVEPAFAASLNLSRFVQIAQIVLSVFLVLGFAGIFSVVKKRGATVVSQGTISPPFKALACFMVVLLLFNAGLLYKVGGEINDSSTLIALDASADFGKFNDQEMVAAKWIGANASRGIIAADDFRYFAVLTFAPAQARTLAAGGSWANLQSGSYIYLGTPNLQTGKLVVGLNPVTSLPTEQDASYYVGGSNLIYSNGYAQVYQTNG